MEDLITLEREGLRMLISPPGREDSYYQGVRFDRSGMIIGLCSRGRSYVQEWFDEYDPFRHDCVTGPVDEFSPNGYDEAAPGDGFLKIGVGILRREGSGPYDWFHSYKVLNEGLWSVCHQNTSAIFAHSIPGIYYYEKEIRLNSAHGFTLSHVLYNEGVDPLVGTCYNHNFFTLGETRVGPWRKVSLPFEPEGTWRSDSISAELTPSGIIFRRELKPGEKAYMGDLRPRNGKRRYLFELSDALKGTTVRCCSEVDFHHIVFWANHRIACVEPFVKYTISPGEKFGWTQEYVCN